VKAGDAKLWVYRRENGYDCQAAEDHKLHVCDYSAWLIKARHFLSGGPIPPCKPDNKSGMRRKRSKAMFRNLKVLLIALMVIAIAGSAYAFAAANTVPATTAGSGASAVGGYTVSNVVYDLDATDPTIVDAITFSISPDTGSEKAVAVLVQTAAAGGWLSCTLADGTLPAVDVTCTYGALLLEDVTALNVVANSTTDPDL
jgi:hypothetical protein